VPAARGWTVTFLALDEPADGVVVQVDGVPVPCRVERRDGRLTVAVDPVPAGATLTVDVGADPRLAAVDVAGRVFAVLDLAHVEYDLKPRVHAVVTSDAPLAVRVSHLVALGLDPALLTAVLEVLLARA
jgi:hypothetical protein